MRRTLGLVALAAALGTAPACLAQDQQLQQQRAQERQLQQQQDRQEQLPDHGQSGYVRSPPSWPRTVSARLASRPRRPSLRRRSRRRPKPTSRLRADRPSAPSSRRLSRRRAGRSASFPRSWMSADIDVVIVGGGAAGIGAARRLAASALSVLLIEATPRLGGRAWTHEVSGLPLDMGCGWLHSADRNAWTRIAEAQRLHDRPARSGVGRAVSRPRLHARRAGRGQDGVRRLDPAHGRRAAGRATAPPTPWSRMARGTPICRRSAVSSAAPGWSASRPPTTWPMTGRRRARTGAYRPATVR